MTDSLYFCLLSLVGSRDYQSFDFGKRCRELKQTREVNPSLKTESEFLPLSKKNNFLERERRFVFYTSRQR